MRMSLETLTVCLSPTYAKNHQFHNKHPVTVKSEKSLFPGIVVISKKAKSEKYLINNGCIPSELQGKKFQLDLRSPWLFAKSITFSIVSKDIIKPVDSTEEEKERSKFSTLSNASLSDLPNASNLSQYLQQELKKNMLISFAVGMKLCLQYMTQKFILKVEDIVPCFHGNLKSAHIGYRCFGGTQVEVTDEEQMNIDRQGLNFESFGGYEGAVKDLKDNVDKLFGARKSVGGILIRGMSGVGKSFIGRILQSMYKDRCRVIGSEDVHSSFKGEAEMVLKKIFSKARARSPSILFIDDIDEICSSRDEDTKNAGIVNAFLYLMDGVQNSCKNDILVIATVVNPDSLDQALRRPGRFSHEIHLPVANEKDRLGILNCLLRKFPLSLITDDLISFIVSRTSGFVAADLVQLLSEAFSYTTEEFPSIEDLRKALSVVKPSSLKNVNTYSRKVSLDQVYGLQTTKSELLKVFKINLHYQKVFTSSGISPPSRVLLFGPTGCGKSALVHGLACRFNLAVIPVSRSSVFGKYFGESEKNINSLFEKAQKSSPCILHFENFDGVAGRRRRNAEVSNDVEGRVINHLKVMLDGVVGFENIFVFAETNRPDLLDKDVIRPGRFHKYFHIDLPSSEDRRDILNENLWSRLSDMVEFHSGEDEFCLTRRTLGFSTAEILMLCKEILSLLGERSLPKDSTLVPILTEAIEDSFETVTPGISTKMVKRFEEFSSVYCSQ